MHELSFIFFSIAVFKSALWKSHRFMMSNDFLAVSASVFLIIAGGNTEWNQAAAQPAADKAQNEAKDPTKSAFLLSDVSHACLSAMLALNSHWVVWPMVNWESTRTTWHLLDDDCLLRLSRHGLSWHGLSWHGLTLHGLTRHGLLHHGLLLHHWLTGHRLLLIGGLTLCDKGLLFRYFAVHFLAFAC